MGSVGEQAQNVGGQGLGTLLSVIDLALAAKSGGIGNALTKRQAMVQDPDMRASIESSPLMAGFLGRYGSMQDATGQPSPLGPSPTGTGPRTFRTNLPPLGPAAQLKLSGEETDQAYKQAQVRKLDRQAAMIGENPQPPPGMILTGQTINPATGNVVYQYGYSKPLITDAVDPSTPGVPTVPGHKVLRPLPKKLTGITVKSTELGPDGTPWRIGQLTPSGGVIDRIVPATDPTARKPRNITGAEAQLIDGLKYYDKTMNYLAEKFPPEERRQYTGFINIAAQHGLQYASGIFPNIRTNKRFAEFANILGELKAYTQTEGGKTLTATEKEMGAEYIPQGNEANPDAFETKFANFRRRTRDILKIRGRRERTRMRKEDPVPAATDRPALSPSTSPSMRAPSRRGQTDTGETERAILQDLGL